MSKHSTYANRGRRIITCRMAGLAAGLLLAALRPVAAATFFVTSTNDSGPGSLRQALRSSMTNVVPDEILFNISGTPPFVITLSNSLETIVVPDTVIRADSQSGYAPGVPAIYLRPSAGSGAQTQPVFASTGGRTTIRGFHISGFTNVAAIAFGGIGASTAAANILVHNNGGVYINGGPNNVIGGFSAGERNIISSNTDHGIRFEAGFNNLVMGNYIGTSTNGLTAWPNRLSGIYINSASGITIRGTAAMRQVISGNGSAGVILKPGARQNLIVGNFIGTDMTGEQPLSNGISGISVEGAADNTIGRTNTGDRNIISGNTEQGIQLIDGARGNSIQANYIGLASNGVTLLSNRLSGIRVLNSSSNFIGGDDRRGNYIGGNAWSGIEVIGTGSVGNLLFGNVVGMGPYSNAAPNAGSANVHIFNARGNSIGGSGLDEGNTLTYHDAWGILIEGSNAAENVVLGNLVGLDSAGVSRPNYSGIGIVQAPSNVVGGFGASSRNIVSGNSNNGLEIRDTSAGAVLLSNYIGLDPTGTFAVSNATYGVWVRHSDHVRIGFGGAINVISGNRLSGIHVDGTSSNTTIAGCRIGTSAAGTSAIPNFVGVTVNADFTTVGGTSALERNLIGGNLTTGIDVLTGRHVRIEGNYIGLSTNGMGAVPNFTGVRIRNVARGITVGGAAAGARNVIARNVGNEVVIEATPGEHLIQNNYIGLRSDGSAFGSLNPGQGVRLDNAPGNRVVSNVVGECYEGIALVGTGSTANVVFGNRIGTDATGTDPAGHLYWGVVIANASSNRIGGLPAGDRNVVAYSGGGILVTSTPGNSAVGNLLAANLVFSNGPNPNVDLGGDGESPNDAGDADVGANNLQNTPTLTNSFIAGPSLVYAQGVLNSAPLRTYAVDVYRNPDGPVPGGRTYLGRVPVTTDGSGFASFTAGFIVNLATSEFLSATATDPDNNTSEFSRSPTHLLTATGDSDGDHIPNFWELLYGLNPAVSNAQGSDLDGDGYSDLEEYIADTAANDADAFPSIWALSRQGEANVTFPSSGVRQYRLFANDDLGGNPAWSQVGSPITGVYGFTTMTDPAITNHRAYRISVQVP